MPNGYVDSGNTRPQQNIVTTDTASVTNAKFFRGVHGMDSVINGQFNPFMGGYIHWVWIKLPAFLANSPRYADLTKAYQNYTERSYKSFQGLNNMTMNFEEIQLGDNAQSMPFATSVTDDFGQFSMRVNEIRGLLINEFHTLWLTGISDPDTQRTHYHGALGDFIPEVNPKYHTASGIYIVTDSSGRSDGIQKAIYISNIVPTTAYYDFLNGEHGQHQQAEFDIEFNGYKRQSAYINKVAKEIMDRKFPIEHYMDWSPRSPIANIEL